MPVEDKEIQKLFDAVERIARTVESIQHRQSPFHLGPCGGCGGPAWQQPCALCGHYPMGRLDPKPACTKEAFVKTVRASAPNGEGNIATFALKDILRGRVPDGVTAWEGLPSPEDAFEAIAVERRVFSRPHCDAVTYKAWHIAFEIGAAIDRLPEMGAFTLAKEFGREMDGIVAGIHEGDSDWDAVADILEERARVVRRQVEMSRNAYMHPLTRDFDDLRKLAAERASPVASGPR